MKACVSSSDMAGSWSPHCINDATISNVPTAYKANARKPTVRHNQSEQHPASQQVPSAAQSYTLLPCKASPWLGIAITMQGLPCHTSLSTTRCDNVAQQTSGHAHHATSGKRKTNTHTTSVSRPLSRIGVWAGLGQRGRMSPIESPMTGVPGDAVWRRCTLQVAEARSHPRSCAPKQRASLSQVAPASSTADVSLSKWSLPKRPLAQAQILRTSRVG